MRYSLQKDRATSMKAWVGQVLKLNRYFKVFLKVNGEAVDILDDTEILGILKNGIPKPWQKEMTVQEFEPEMEGMKNFIDFCGRIESCELDGQDDNNVSFQ